MDGISPPSILVKGCQRTGVTLRGHAHKKGDRCTMRGETCVAAQRTVEIVLRRAPRSVGHVICQPNVLAQQHPLCLQMRGDVSGHQPAGWFREDVAGRRLTWVPSGVRWVEYAMIIALTSIIAIGVRWVRAWWAMP